MVRQAVAVLVALSAAVSARGHFAFVIPEADGAAAKLVFSDTLAPDPKVNVEKLADTKLVVRDAAGKETPLTCIKSDAFYQAAVPGSGPRVVYGATEYGVLQKGEAKPYRLVYHPKAVFGAVPAAAATIGAGAALEVVPVTTPGKVAFRVLAAGKPVADSEVRVMLPGGEKKDIKTDADGMTGAFEPTGRYGVYAKRIEATAGEHAGKRYDEVRRYATLVVDVK